MVIVMSTRKQHNHAVFEFAPHTGRRSDRLYGINIRFSPQ